MKFAERLKELRTSKGLTYEQIAIAIGAHRTSISLWERGIKGITDTHIVALAKFFGVTAGYLLGLED